MSNISATEFMESFSGGEKPAKTYNCYTTEEELQAALLEERGELVEQWEAGRWVTRWSKTGQEVRG
jgi:hypothetical protein